MHKNFIWARKFETFKVDNFFIQDICLTFVSEVLLQDFTDEVQTTLQILQRIDTCRCGLTWKLTEQAPRNVGSKFPTNSILYCKIL
jgi:hypothetical protein